MSAFWLSMALLFLAELGDKTQLVALSFATRIKAWVVCAGIFVSTLLVILFSAFIGDTAGALLPTNWIKFAAGLAFIGFGLWTLWGDQADGEETGLNRIKSPFWLVFFTIFLAELGDKTMLSTVTLAATNPFIPVWLGSTLGMVIADGLAILVGKVLGAKLPEQVVKIAAAVIFFGFGILSMIQGGASLPSFVWGPAILIIAALCLLF
ncbi:MAG: TMEM165/GDT1 family protein, partial [Patescibacteria group bacterium]